MQKQTVFLQVQKERFVIRLIFWILKMKKICRQGSNLQHKRLVTAGYRRLLFGYKGVELNRLWR